jgi:hypothetical protein
MKVKWSPVSMTAQGSSDSDLYGAALCPDIDYLPDITDICRENALKSLRFIAGKKNRNNRSHVESE